MRSGRIEFKRTLWANRFVPSADGIYTVIDLREDKGRNKNAVSSGY